MMLRIAAVIACGGVMAGCAARPPDVPPAPNPELAAGYIRPSDKDAIEAAKKAVAAKLKDPESARFDKIVRWNSPNARGEPTDVVCGSVNAKNSYGGMTGFGPFVYVVARKDATIAEHDFVDVAIVKTFCGTSPVR